MKVSRKRGSFPRTNTYPHRRRSVKLRWKGSAPSDEELAGFLRGAHATFLVEELDRSSSGKSAVLLLPDEATVKRPGVRRAIFDRRCFLSPFFDKASKASKRSLLSQATNFAIRKDMEKIRKERSARDGSLRRPQTLRWTRRSRSALKRSDCSRPTPGSASRRYEYAASVFF